MNPRDLICVFSSTYTSLSLHRILLRTYFSKEPALLTSAAWISLAYKKTAEHFTFCGVLMGFPDSNADQKQRKRS